MKKIIFLLSIIFCSLSIVWAYDHLSISEYKNCKMVEWGLDSLKFYINKVNNWIPIYSWPWREVETHLIEYDINELNAQRAELLEVKLNCDVINLRKEDKELEDHIAEDWRDARIHLSSFTIEILDSLVPIYKEKDKKTQENVKEVLKKFESSKDNYTRNVWIYFWYLISKNS